MVRLPKLQATATKGKKRLGYDGPAPTLAVLRRQGIRALSVTCHSLWRGHTCHRTSTVTLDELAALDGVAFTELRRHLAFVCDRCGGRTMHIVPLWPDPREAHVAATNVNAFASRLPQMNRPRLNAFQMLAPAFRLPAMMPDSDRETADELPAIRRRHRTASA